MNEILLTLALGGGAGLLSTYLGLGGGVIFVTFLPLFFAMDAKVSIGTSLFAVFLLVLRNVWGFHRRGLIEWRVVSIVLPAGILFAYLGGRFAFLFSDKELIGILATTLTLLTVWSLVKQWTLSRIPKEPGVASLVRMTAVGTVSGSLSGLTGIGSGAIIGAFLINWRLVRNECVAPTANGMMIFTTFFGAIAYLTGVPSYPSWGFVRLDLAFILFAGAFVTSAFGHKYQGLFPEGARRIALTLLLLGLSVKEWLRFIEI